MAAVSVGATADAAYATVVHQRLVPAFGTRTQRTLTGERIYCATAP